MILNTPIEVLWCLTGRCNLDCIFCLADAGHFSARSELGRAERDFIVSELIKNRVLKVYLTGGEPLLLPEITYYIRNLQKHNIFVEITTNGTLFNDDLLEEIKNKRTIRVQVSLNGSSPQINDPLMGQSYAKIISNLKKLVAAGISTHVKITISKNNIADIPGLIEQLYRMGLNQLELSEILPLGRGYINYQELIPDLQDINNLREEIAGFSQKNNLHVRFHSFRLTLKEKGRASTCTVGHPSSRTCLIMQDGDVIPCTSASIWEVKNNILEKGLKSCWQDLKTYRQFLNYSKLKGKCGGCRLKIACQGGCRALAYQFTSDLWGEYPLCPYPSYN
jgi:radical SAM protein with 4Fe4S-binding SPASM domain